MSRAARFASLSLVLVACRPERPAPADPTPPAPPVQPASAPLEPWLAQLNLSFEEDELGPWRIAAGDASLDDDARVGARSLKVTCRDGQGIVMGELPIERVRDRRVRLGAWIRTAEVPGYAGLWLRVDGAGGVLDFATMAEEGPKGSSAWGHHALEIDVPPTASKVAFGVDVTGGGAAWFDGLELAVQPYVPPGPITVSGVVLDERGAPVPGALVAGVSRAPSPVLARAGADGRFALELHTGTWAFTATSPQGSAYREPAAFRGAGEVTLRLASGGFTLRGAVSVVGERPRLLRVVALRLSEVEGDHFVAEVEADGRFTLRLPEAQGYLLNVEGEGVLASPQAVAGRGDQQVALAASVPGPPPASVVTWIGRSAAPLAGFEVDGDLADMRPMRKIVRGAEVVALGEATHGTREFFQLKHRLLEYLVLREGFTLFAIEANLTEARAVDDYVLTGAGDPAAALAGLYFWTWNTEEVLALIEWMRRYNADPAHKEKLRFLGVDMQTTAVAWSNVAAFLARLDPGRPPPAGLEIFASKRVDAAWRVLSPAERAAHRAALDAIVARLDGERAAIVAREGARAWRHAREDARLVAQAAEVLDAPNGIASFNLRDKAMAENVLWLREQEGAARKMVLWAHNGHIARGSGDLVPMGGRLREALGPRYLGVGFAFAEGAFQAIDGEVGGLREFTVGPPSERDLSTAFTRAGCERCYVDLRRAPKGEVSDWLRSTQQMRDIGALFSGEAAMNTPVRLAEVYDALVFVRKTTRARPVAAKAR